MNYHNITHNDILNGSGLRVVLWVAGCEHRCHNCHNQMTWDICGGLPFDAEAKEEILQALKQEHISGVTLSGGDPLHPLNRGTVEDLICEINQKYPEKNIWIYTGYSWEEVKNLPLMRFVTVLVDGKFVEDLKYKGLKWRGSANQHVIDVQASLQNNEIILWE